MELDDAHRNRVVTRGVLTENDNGQSYALSFSDLIGWIKHGH